MDLRCHNFSIISLLISIDPRHSLVEVTPESWPVCYICVVEQRSSHRALAHVRSLFPSAKHLTTHGVDYDHGGVYGAAKRDHGPHGDGGVVGAEGPEDAEVARAVRQLA